MITFPVVWFYLEAERAKERLKYIGIQSVLKQSKSLVGRIHMEVAQHRAQEAIDFLDQKTWKFSKSVGEKTAIAMAQTLEKLPSPREADEPKGRITPREKLATKTFRMAIFSLMFPLLFPVALFLFGRLYFSRGRLQGQPRRHAIYAGTFLVFTLLLFSLIFWWEISLSKQQ